MAAVYASGLQESVTIILHYDAIFLTTPMRKMARILVLPG
jgi:hypothetical protein